MIGSRDILPVKGTVTIEAMFNFDEGFDGHGDGDIPRKQSFNDVQVQWDLLCTAIE